MASSAYSFLDLLAIYLTCIQLLLRLQVIYFVFPVFVCTCSGLKSYLRVTDVLNPILGLYKATFLFTRYLPSTL
jgi:hypothetical protein